MNLENINFDGISVMLLYEIDSQNVIVKKFHRLKKSELQTHESVQAIHTIIHCRPF